MQLASGRWITHTLPANLDMATIPPQMLIAQDNSLWITGLLGGVLRYDGKDWENYAYSYSEEQERTYIIMGIDSIFETFDGKIWITTNCCDGPTVFYYWDERGWISDDLNETNRPYRVYRPTKGKNGIVWFEGSDGSNRELGMSSSSIEYHNYNNREWIHFFIPKDLWGEGNWIRAFALTSAENVWIGSHQGNIAHFDGIRWEIVSPEGGLGSAIFAMTIAPDDTLWVGTHNGILAHLQGETWTLYKVESGIWPIP